MLVYIFHPKGIFKVAEINCLAEVPDSLCYEESLHTYVYAHTHTHIYTWQNSPYLHNILETSQPKLLRSHKMLFRAQFTLF